MSNNYRAAQEIMELYIGDEDALEEDTLIALGRVAGDSAVSKILDIYNAKRDPDIYFKRRVISALGMAGGYNAATEIIEIYKTDSVNLKSETVAALGEVGTYSAIDMIMNIYNDNKESISKKEVIVALGVAGSKEIKRKNLTPL